MHVFAQFPGVVKCVSDKIRSSGRLWSWPVFVLLMLAHSGAAAAQMRADAAAQSTLWVWGNNTHGQLGTGPLGFQREPAPAVGLTDAVTVAGGAYFFLALRADGSVWAWGDNTYGQLGDGTTTSRSLPQPVPGLSGISAIAAGGYHALALKSDGTVVAWGSNSSGQLGNGTLNNSVSPQPVFGLTGVVAIGAGFYHSLAVKDGGTVWSWGYNAYGQLGNGSKISQTTPVQALNLTGVTAVAGGGYHSLALKSGGGVWAWGYNGFGALGNGSLYSRNYPIQVACTAVISSIAAGYYDSMAVSSEGTLYTWGANSHGELGNGNFFVQIYPTPVLQNASLTNGRGYSHSVALLQDGTVAVCGSNFYGQLGDGTNQEHFTPMAVPALPGITMVAATNYATAAVKADGTVWCFGLNLCGECGNGAVIPVDQPLPVPVPGFASALQVCAGYCHNLAVKPDGSVWGWGANNTGQLGDGTFLSRFAPAPVAGLTGVSSLSGGGWHTLALLPDGSVRSWGGNYFGQLGNGSTQHNPWPEAVPGLTGVVAVAAGGSHSLALKADGTVVAWGSDGAGQLGDGSYEEQPTPVPVLWLTDITAIAAGWAHSLALKADGTVMAWGANHYGQLGINQPGVHEDPIATLVPHLTGVVAIAAGQFFSMFLKSDGTVWTCGDNGFGQLGDGGQVESSDVPFVIPGFSGVSQIAAGDQSGFALKSDGQLFSWGFNRTGMLGIGTTSDTAFPVGVDALTEVTQISAGDLHTLAVTGGTPFHPVITDPPHDVSVRAGQTAALAVTATGPVPLHYAWYEGVSGQTGTPAPGGADSPHYTTPVLSANTSYWVRVANAWGQALSPVATVTVIPCPRPQIGDQPASQTICSGQSASLNVAATGNSPLHYAWYQGVSGNTTIPAPGGTDAASYTTPTLTATAKYWVRVTNDCGQIDTDAATITVNQPPNVTSQCPDLALCCGQSAALSVTAAGATPLHYAWYVGSSGAVGTPAPGGADQPSYSTPPLTSPTCFWVRISNECGYQDSATFDLTMKQPPDITTHPLSQTVASGAAVSLQVAATGDAPLHYQWYQGLRGNTAQPVGSDSPTFVSPPQAANTCYWVRVANDCGICDSLAADVSVVALSADLNQDGVVNGLDAFLEASFLAATEDRLPCGLTCPDVNNDGRVDALDLLEILRAEHP